MGRAMRSISSRRCSRPRPRASRRSRWYEIASAIRRCALALDLYLLIVMGSSSWRNLVEALERQVRKELVENVELEPGQAPTGIHDAQILLRAHPWNVQQCGGIGQPVEHDAVRPGRYRPPYRR